ncbi:nuclear transport factor 2 family protein [Dyadobacter sandarakinus]|uniref:Nuclear transport factor 2 family protein n=1 Tax=Dyadobacter sandarakinus TaxID=2747268 RepID=A0ABX7I650_9BACT|nr:nuclear transport factor 2 family protein [Dyadobacter sandarakinus]QRR01349.1 nuclear transport factor 2 family protein [Dyadobacter sandarakinus]
MKLPENIAGFIQAQNEADSTAFANYFTEQAIVSDEDSSYTGRSEIKQWIEEAIEKYKMQSKVIDFKQTGSKGTLIVEASGDFPGSPGVMHYHMEFDGELIRSLRITG